VTERYMTQAKKVACVHFCRVAYSHNSGRTSALGEKEEEIARAIAAGIFW